MDVTPATLVINPADAFTASAEWPSVLSNPNFRLNQPPGVRVRFSQRKPWANDQCHRLWRFTLEPNARCSTHLLRSLPSGLSRRGRQLRGYLLDRLLHHLINLLLSVGLAPAVARLASYMSANQSLLPPGQARRRAERRSRLRVAKPVVIPPGQAGQAQRKSNRVVYSAAGLPTPPLGGTGGLPELAQIVALGDIRSDVVRGRRPRCCTQIPPARPADRSASHYKRASPLNSRRTVGRGARSPLERPQPRPKWNAASISASETSLPLVRVFLGRFGYVGRW